MSVDWNAGAMMPQIRQAVMRGVISWAGRVEAEGTRLIVDVPGTGKIYRRRGVDHQASAPGEPPASDTGTLANSVFITPFEPMLMARITWATAYAARLQFGDEKIEPRPWANVALANVSDMGLQDVRMELGALFK